MSVYAGIEFNNRGSEIQLERMRLCRVPMLVSDPECDVCLTYMGSRVK